MKGFNNFKFCPFCGASDKRKTKEPIGVLRRDRRQELCETRDCEDTSSLYSVICNSCLSIGPMSDDPQKAIKLWNRRAKHER